MRAAHLLCGLTTLLATSLLARAEALPNVPYEATIMAAEVDVRSGPSADAKYYPTSKLRQGEKAGPGGKMAAGGHQATARLI